MGIVIGIAGGIIATIVALATVATVRLRNQPLEGHPENKSGINSIMETGENIVTVLKKDNGDVISRTHYSV